MPHLTDLVFSTDKLYFIDLINITSVLVVAIVCTQSFYSTDLKYHYIHPFDTDNLFMEL